MGYYVDVTGTLSFAAEQEKTKFIEALSNDPEFSSYETVEDLLYEELGIDADTSDNELDYELSAQYIHYINQEDTISSFLHDNNIDAKFFMEFHDKDGSCWRVNHNTNHGCISEDKVFLSDEIKKPTFRRGLYSAKSLDTGESVTGNLIYKGEGSNAYILTSQDYERMTVDSSSGEAHCRLIQVSEDTLIPILHSDREASLTDYFN